MSMPKSYSPPQALLALLADGQWHSGEALGHALGVSRAAVAKKIKQLELYGLSVDITKGRGYRLPGGLDLIDAPDVRSRLARECGDLCRFELFDSIDSTNQYLMDQARTGSEVKGHIVAAEKQTAGRGRRGRAWHSPYASNLYFSVAWRFEQGLRAVEGLSLAVGLVVCQVLERVGLTTGLELKWPNDLLFGGRKLAGILIEVGGDAISDCLVVIGIGLNVHMRNASPLDTPWASLPAEGGWSRSALLADLGAAIVTLLQTYPERGFKDYQVEWNQRCAYSGQAVVLSGGGQLVQGILCGVSSNGALQLCIEGEVTEFIGGELSLRPYASTD